ncbi:uncharacterized protein G2W53_026078 [Senna tora]|uniref:Survival Motor Neuron Gemin2-binding domain-containing protein n=1 Tax=Senna tora TaxID=362788 RepID=A0A834WH39_9FABA|nr:uncharacterized protein G2W53_026078 [Senna tora]
MTGYLGELSYLSMGKEDDLWDDFALIKAFDRAISTYKHIFPFAANLVIPPQFHLHHPCLLYQQSDSSAFCSSSKHTSASSSFSPKASSSSCFSNPTAATTRRRFLILVIIGLVALFRGYVPLMAAISHKLSHRKLPSEVGGESDASKELRTDVGDETKVEARQQIDASDEESTLLLTRSKCWVCLDPP